MTRKVLVQTQPDLPDDLFMAMFEHFYREYADATRHFENLSDEMRERVGHLDRRLQLGAQYYEQGYRFQETDPQVAGFDWSPPSDALVWRVLFTGYIGTNEAERLQYITKVEATTA